MTVKVPPSPFGGLIDLRDEYAPARKDVLQSESSVDYLIRHRGDEMVAAGALFKVAGRWKVNPEIADTMLMQFFKEGGIRPSSAA